ncbi:efflux transporter outer membrane subunit [Methylomonas sp. SURF-2]|uniref:Efflux transporter outer membrane subunit n=1 Tax=Methylomonas subterranea TaxID=2952225 RepID=A0ABT1TL24_9GAMM|nr:efflux transporter outer membrane subunit [Methylomonas sp. SURF-2]MCQ8105782.1 efflux transporter outer membrane subunit [Methylomonas sp. SURF-2]
MRPIVYPLFVCSSLALPLTACTVGPDYIRPEASVSAEFKEVKGWKQASPRDNALPGNWWEVFNDPQLNVLEQQVAGANQTIAQAEAQYRQAQHLVQSAQASLLPLAMLNGGFNRFKAATGQSVAVSGVRNLFSQAVNIAWEPDLWGKVRRQLEANIDSAQASAATLHALILSSQAALADSYFQMKVLDAQKALLEETLAAFGKNVEITQNRYDAGVVSKADVAQAQTQLETARAQAIDLGVQRARLEHAIAVLIGKTPAEVSLPALELAGQLPEIPLSLPSELLERRPDIAAAERNMAAANAQIGVAKAAYYPTLNLAATNGFQSSDADTLFTMAKRFWALGPAGVALTLFDGGARNAQYKQAMAAYDASVAGYRQTVLTGFQEVEDSLAALRILEREAQVQDKAVAAARQSLVLIQNQYKAGTVSYLNVIVTQAAELSSRQTALQLRGQRLAASVALVKALGGGWNQSQLPGEDEAGGERKWTDYLILPLVD